MSTRSSGGLEALEKSDHLFLSEQYGTDYERKIESIVNVPETEDPVIDENRPTVLLTTFLGCKGLQAGHVFVVGVNNGEIPRDPANIDDIEVCQFIVAMTRSRKACHIVSNKWFGMSKDKKSGNWIPETTPSVFMSWLPSRLKHDYGYIRANTVNTITC